MALSLEEFYAETLERLPVIDDEEFILDSQSCLLPPDGVLETARLRLMVGASHWGDTIQITHVHAFADTTTYGCLGLLIFAGLFDPLRRETILHLRHPGSQVRTVRLDGRWPVMPRELDSQPTAFSYWPEAPTSRHPLYDPLLLDDSFRPYLDLQREGETYALEGFGQPHAAARLGCLLLDLRLPGTTGAEFVLEGCPSACQSVATTSAQATFWIGEDYPF